MSDHPNSEMLVDGAWLEAHLNDANLRIVDCGSRDAYLRAHIPGAVFPADANFKDTTPERSRFVMPPDQFAQAKAALGIGDETQVVAYDAAQVTAGRLWWCLQYYGHSNVRILDGGWNQWLQDTRPIAMGDARDGGSAAAKAGPFTAVAHPELYATAEHIMEILNNPNAIVLDVRSDGEWNGTVSRGNKRQGHMPGNAVHLEWTNYLTPDDVRGDRRDAGQRGRDGVPGRHPRRAGRLHPDPPGLRKRAQLRRQLRRMGQPGRHADHHVGLIRRGISRSGQRL